MDELEQIIMRLIEEVEQLKERVNDLEGQVGETTSVEVSTTFPSEPYDGQVVIRSDEIGNNDGGNMYTYSSDVGDWLNLTQ